MQSKTETIRARVVPQVKYNAEAIFEALGLSATDAINLFYTQVILNQGLPFEVKLPNKKTIKEIIETKQGKGLIKSSLSDLRKKFK